MFYVRFWWSLAPGSLFFWDTPKDEEEWRLASICGVFYILSFFLIKIGVSQSGFSKVSFLTLAMIFFFAAYILEKIAYPVVKLRDPFAEPCGSECECE